MSDKNEGRVNFKATTMGPKLSYMPLSHNPMLGMQDICKTELTNFGDLKISDKMNVINDLNRKLYENIKDKLPNINYMIVHKHFLKNAKDDESKNKLRYLLDNAEGFEVVEKENIEIAKKMEKKMKNNFK